METRVMAGMSGGLVFRNGIARIWIQVRPQQMGRFLPSGRARNIDDTLGRYAVPDPFADCLSAHTKRSGGISIGIEELENFHGSYYYNQ